MSILLPVTSPKKSPLPLNDEDKQSSAAGTQLSWVPAAELCLSSLYILTPHIDQGILFA